MASSGIKRAWVERAIRYINDQPKGVDSWPAQSNVPVVYLDIDANPHFDISDTSTGRTVEFYMHGEHMATITYGTKPVLRRRPHLKTDFRV